MFTIPIHSSPSSSILSLQYMSFSSPFLPYIPNLLPSLSLSFSFSPFTFFPPLHTHSLSSHLMSYPLSSSLLQIPSTFFPLYMPSTLSSPPYMLHPLPLHLPQPPSTPYLHTRRTHHYSRTAKLVTDSFTPSIMHLHTRLTYSPHLSVPVSLTPHFPTPILVGFSPPSHHFLPESLTPRLAHSCPVLNLVAPPFPCVAGPLPRPSRPTPPDPAPPTQGTYRAACGRESVSSLVACLSLLRLLLDGSGGFEDTWRARSLLVVASSVASGQRRHRHDQNRKEFLDECMSVYGINRLLEWTMMRNTWKRSSLNKSWPFFTEGR